MGLLQYQYVQLMRAEHTGIARSGCSGRNPGSLVRAGQGAVQARICELMLERGARLFTPDASNMRDSIRHNPQLASYLRTR